MTNQTIIDDMTDKVRLLTYEVESYRQALKDARGVAERGVCHRNIERLEHLINGYMAEIERVKDIGGSK